MKKSNKRFLSLFVALGLVLSSGLNNGIGKVKAAEVGSNVSVTKAAQSASREMSSSHGQNWRNQKYGNPGNFDDNKPVANQNENVRVIVQLEDKPAVERKNANVSTVKSAQEAIKAQVKSKTGAVARNTYGYLVNGFSTTVKRSDIPKIEAIPGVKKVTEAKVYYPDLTYAKSLTQVYDTWKDYGIKGEGMVVAVIDTGIDASHKDMKLTDPSKAKIKDIKNSSESVFTAKVPYGHNFADQNDVVKDLTSSMHGMHVSGIVGANASNQEVLDLQGVQGVAPECQLLAMKVFSNDPNNTGAYSDDIVAAIEDSVLHGADVINMSLGSNAAFQDPDDPEQMAIKNATDKGTLVVVSAGNSEYSTYPYKIAGMPDTGLVGAPGLAHDSLQVASYENTNVTCPALSYTNGDASGAMCYFTSEISPVGVLNGQYDMVDCIYGRSSDFQGKDLKGKIALIQRGGTGSAGFLEKKQLAQAAGAAGVIIYNDAARGDAYVSMVTDTSIKIPAIFIGNTDGAYLLKNIATTKIAFKDGVVKSVVNTAANDMSDFTSWGPTPNLDFKPEIAAPGGNIYSTVNNNKYESMSGTSMAAPHTTGGEALILQAIKKANPSLTGRALVDFAKANAINTSTTLMDKAHPTVPYSPRRQGAGLLQIENAIKNTVTVLDNSNNAAVALKEIGNTTTYTLNLKNYGGKDVTYTLGNIGGVLTEQGKTINTMTYDVKIGGATISYSSPTVTVPANGSASVDVTVSLPKGFATEQFVEGFVKFTANDTSVPSLVSPFIGFYGDWSKQPVIDAPLWDTDNAVWGESTLLTKNADGKYYYLGWLGQDDSGYPVIDPSKIAISPNGDGYNDNVTPKFTFFRNAKEMQVVVLDSDKKVISQVALDANIRKNLLGDPDDPGYKISNDWTWNGTIYNAATGKYEIPKDGQYYLNYVTKVDIENAKPQDYIVPVQIDTTAPEVAITSASVASNTTYHLTWTAEDKGSGLDYMSLIVNGQEQEGLPISYADGVFSCDITLAPNVVNNVQLAAVDFANNVTAKNINVREGNIPFSLTIDNLDSGISVDSSTVTVTGKVSFKPASLKVYGVDAVINDDLTFSAAISLKEGVNYVSFDAKDFDGSTLASYSRKVYCDTVAPVLTLTSPVINQDGKAYTNTNTIKVSGTASDNTLGYKFYLNGEQKFVVSLDGTQGSEATSRSFEYTVPVTNNSFVEVRLVDLFGHTTVKNINVVVDKDAPVITVSGVEDGKSYNTDVKPVISANEGQVISTLDGKTYDNSVISAEGKHELVVTASDLAGNTATYKVDFTIDKTAPTITITGIENGKTYNKEVTPQISANEGRVTSTLDGKAYDNSPVAAEGKHELEVTAVDSVGNTSTSKIEFTIDKTAPIITVTGVEDGKSYNNDVTPQISANEGQITSTLDGNAYNNSAVTAEGKHELEITAVDKAGNTATKKLSFTVDKTAPIISIKSVENEKSYDNVAKPEVSVSEGTFTMTLDGKQYTGAAISAAGDHELVISAKDEAGNTAEASIRFTVSAVLSGSSAGAAAQAIANSNDKQVKVVLNDTTKIDKSIFTAVAGQDKKVSFTVNTNNAEVTWTFDAKDIDPANIKDIDLSLNVQAPSKDLIGKIDANAQILSFKDNGVLPAPALLKIKLDPTKVDFTKPIYFYYYNPATKSTEVIAGPLTPDKDGYVEVTIKHCSDYFFSNGNGQAASGSTSGGTVTTIPKTGSMFDMNILLGIGLLLIASGALFAKHPRGTRNMTKNGDKDK